MRGAKKMPKITRFGVSLDQDLLKKFDRLAREKKYTCRSEALRDLIRRELVQKQWKSTGEIAGAVTLVYNHHKRELVNKLMDIQHDFSKTIISTQHIHLDHNNCLEIIAVHGSPREVRKLTDNLAAVKGVKHAALNMSTTGKEIQ